MVSLRSIALLALFAYTAGAGSLRIGAAATSKSISRELSQAKIAGYEPKTDVTDHVSRMTRCPLTRLSLASVNSTVSDLQHVPSFRIVSTGIRR
jgi:hypothetical protein